MHSEGESLVRGLCWALSPGENSFFAEEWKRKDMIQAGGAGGDGGVGMGRRGNECKSG